MKFLEALDVLKRVVENDNGEFSQEIIERINEDDLELRRHLGIRRTSKKEFVAFFLPLKDSDDSLQSFSSYCFLEQLPHPNGERRFCRFFMDDYFAEDWECGIVDFSKGTANDGEKIFFPFDDFA